MTVRGASLIQKRQKEGVGEAVCEQGSVFTYERVGGGVRVREAKTHSIAFRAQHGHIA
jgi:hypothetical protein